MVGALVGDGGEEGVEEVAVGGVDFEDSCNRRRWSKCLAAAREVEGDAVDVAGRGALWGWRRRGRRGWGRQGRRLAQPPGLRWGYRSVRVVDAEGAGGGGFAAGVGELDGGDGVHGFDEAGDAGEGFDVGIEVEAGVVGGDAAFGGDGGGFAENEGVPPHRAGAEVDEVEVVGVAVVGGIHAHGGDGEAVFEGDAAEGDGVEDGGHGDSVANSPIVEV